MHNARSNQDTIMRLNDYKKPAFKVPQTILHFDLGHEETQVEATYHIESCTDTPEDLVLDGEAMQLKSLAINGKKYQPSEYSVNDKSLTIPHMVGSFTLTVVVTISPKDNSVLSGLYSSGDNLCTQCESHGFRRIVYSIDRPDILSVYQVSIAADPKAFNTVLANGNQVAETTLTDGRKQVTFVDPAPKPSYLFALVAGCFVSREETYEASNGRKHHLAIHLPNQYPIEQADVAMQALKQAMRWDEETYGCFYDLDSYHVVAMPDFNFGAMENKGLNIFNTSALLADPKVATDASHLRVHTVVGHEYFHNWTGNRVTVRDWFQISLKEGLTTYREMCFGMDTYSPLARLDYIFDLVERQFAEDDGPSAHELLPKTAESIENLYTATTYTKGAEVLRMLEDLLGHDKACAAVRAYLAKYDGQAATIEDFLGVVAETANMDMQGFLAWYHQKGTPCVEVTQDYDPIGRVCTLRLVQKAARTDLQEGYHALMMPVRIKFWRKSGQPMQLNHAAAKPDKDGGLVLTFTQTTQTWTFHNIAEEPVVSAFRGLSAPVLIKQNLDKTTRGILMGCEDDLFSRFQQARFCWLDILHEGGEIDEQTAQAIDRVLDQALDQPEAVDVVFRLPEITYCQETVGGFDFDALCQAHKKLKDQIASRWQEKWYTLMQQASAQLTKPYTWNAHQAAFRRLRALALANLVRADAKYICQAENLYREADNITDQMAALVAVIGRDSQKTQFMLEDFYQKAQGHDLQMDRWFWLQAGRTAPAPIEEIKKLLTHKSCDWRRPNRIMTVFAGWLSQHAGSVHDKSGQGYEMIGETIKKLDTINPSTACRLLKPLMRWACYDADRKMAMQKVLVSLQEQVSATNLQEKLRQALA